MSKILLPMTVQNDSYQDNIVIQIDSDTIESWYHNILNLLKGEISSLAISSKPKGFRLEICKDETIPPFERGRIHRNPGHWTLSVSDNELKTWESFFSKFYMEGVGDVDHIDVDIGQSLNGVKGVFVVIKIPIARPPLSIEEVKRKIGLTS